MEPAVEGCFFVDALLLFVRGFFVAGWFVSCVAEGRGSIWGVEVVAGGCLAPDRDRRLAVVAVVVTVVCVGVSFMLATEPKERERAREEEGERKKILI